MPLPRKVAARVTADLPATSSALAPPVPVRVHTSRPDDDDEMPDFDGAGAGAWDTVGAGALMLVQDRERQTCLIRAVEVPSLALLVEAECYLDQKMHELSPVFYATECADDLMLGLEFTCTSDARRFANKFAALAPKSHEHAADAHDAPSAEASDGAHTKGEVAREKARVATGKVLAATSKVVKAAVPQRIQRRATRNVFKFKNRFFGGRKEGHISEVMTVEHEGHIDMAAGGMDFSNLPPDHPLAAALAQSGMSATDLKDPAKAKEVMALMTVSETGGGSAGAGSAAASPSPSPPPTAASPTTEFDVAHDAAAGAEAHAEAGAGEWVGEGESGGHEAAAADDGWPADGVSAAAAPTAVDDGTSDTEGTRERAPSL